MGFIAAAKSAFTFVSTSLTSKHAWQYNEFRDVRTCTVCGRAEAFTVDVMSTEWSLVDHGDDLAHAPKAGAAKPAGIDGHATLPATP